MREKIYDFKTMKVLTGDLPWEQLWRYRLLLPGWGMKRSRDRMIALIRKRGIRDARVLHALEVTPRHEFMPESVRAHAYDDRALPIGDEQTISQPYVVALMTELLRLQGDERVLEIGTGSGYQTAILAQLAGHVYTVEINTSLSQCAQGTLGQMGFKNISYRTGDGWRGWPEEAPFDRILVTAAPPCLPRRLVQQVGPGGRLVLPVGSQETNQTLWEIEREPDGSLIRHAHGPVLFVPMIGNIDSPESRDCEERPAG